MVFITIFSPPFGEYVWYVCHFSKHLIKQIEVNDAKLGIEKWKMFVEAPWLSFLGGMKAYLEVEPAMTLSQSPGKLLFLVFFAFLNGGFIHVFRVHVEFKGTVVPCSNKVCVYTFNILVTTMRFSKKPHKSFRIWCNVAPVILVSHRQCLVGRESFIPLWDPG